MNREQAYTLIRQAFTQAFDKARFRNFAINLLNRIDESKAQAWNTQYVKDAFKDHVGRYERLGTYTSPENEKLDVLIVHVTAESKLERARTAIRNFVADHLKTRDEKDAALVAFVSPSQKQWRFSYVKMEYATVEKESGKVGVETHLTPARRFSYIVGEGESCHTAQTRFLSLLQDTQNDPKLADIEEAFSVEAVTKEFFNKYRDLFIDIHAALEKLVEKDKSIRDEFNAKNVNTVDFAKKLMGQIVFLYFLQKKGWLGVAKGQDWGSGPHDFLRRLANREYREYSNFFNDILEPLFYDTLATERGHEAWCDRFQCRMPFLNGGLFEPLRGYDWLKTDILLANRLFTNNDHVEEGITGTGVLDVFDRYNFTVNEAEPLEKEVAIDPEMLGKVFEKLGAIAPANFEEWAQALRSGNRSKELEANKKLGVYYTPREIVHYMCQESLINYLHTALNWRRKALIPGKAKQAKLFGEPEPEQMPLKQTVHEELVPRPDIETFVHLGEQISHYEAVKTDYPVKMPKSIEKHAGLIDDKLADITVCDPAVGSGAFLVGMMTETVRARSALTPYFIREINENEQTTEQQKEKLLQELIAKRSAYSHKKDAIQNCLYGVDIDPGAVEIAKLRLWLSLVVDEEDVKQIKPLPNLDYKIVAGNSLLGVEKDLFNNHLFIQLERLKPQYFDESETSQKASLKNEIDALIQQLANNKETFDFEIYFSEVFQKKKGFDVVIANPPYGANIPANDLEKIRPQLRDTKNMNSAALFIDFAKNKLSHDKGTVSFIVPKSLLFCEDWFSLVKAMLDNTLVLVDVEKAFERVLLEQVVFVLARHLNIDRYLGRKFLNNEFVRETVILNKYVLLFEAWICDVSKTEIGLAERIRSSGIPLRELVHCFRGFPIQRCVKEKGSFPVIGGKNLLRYGVSGVKGYLTKNDYQNLSKKIARFAQPKLMAQNLVAHIQNPKPHIQVTVAFDECGEVMNFDTVTNIIPTSQQFCPKFILAVLNSTLTSWFAYKFIFCAAIRTMHFDRYYVGKIVMPIADAAQQRDVVQYVDRIVAEKKRDPAVDTTEWEREIDRLVYELYGVTEDEIKLVEESARR